MKEKINVASSYSQIMLCAKYSQEYNRAVDLPEWLDDVDAKFVSTPSAVYIDTKDDADISVFIQRETPQNSYYLGKCCLISDINTFSLGSPDSAGSSEEVTITFSDDVIEISIFSNSLKEPTAIILIVTSDFSILS